MMMNLDIPNREIVKNKTLMSPVIDIKIPKALPTTGIVPTQKQKPQKLKEYKNKLPQSELELLNL